MAEAELTLVSGADERTKPLLSPFSAQLPASFSSVASPTRERSRLQLGPSSAVAPRLSLSAVASPTGSSPLVSPRSNEATPMASLSASPSRRPRLLMAMAVRLGARPGGSGAPHAVLAVLSIRPQDAQKPVLQSLLAKIDPAVSGNKSYVHGLTGFHYVYDCTAGLCLLCMAERDLGRRRPQDFLRCLQESFGQLFSHEDIRVAYEGGMQAIFEPEIQRVSTMQGLAWLDVDTTPPPPPRQTQLVAPPADLVRAVAERLTPRAETAVEVPAEASLHTPARRGRCREHGPAIGGLLALAVITFLALLLIGNSCTLPEVC